MSTVKLDVQWYGLELETIEFLPSCPGCAAELAVHQPDIYQPERLLGICECCGAWYLLTDDAAVKLPNERELKGLAR